MYTTLSSKNKLMTDNDKNVLFLFIKTLIICYNDQNASFIFCNCWIAKSAGRSKLYWLNFSNDCNASSKPEKI